MRRTLASEVARDALELGRRASAAGALLIGVLGLLAHAPLWLVCARALATLVLLQLAVRIGAAALVLACECDGALEEEETREEGRG